MPSKGFHDLPAEIRNEVYGYCIPDIAILGLVGGSTITNECDRFVRGAAKLIIQQRTGNDLLNPFEGVPILQLDRKVRAEAAALMYEQSTFAIALPVIGIAGGFFRDEAASSYYVQPQKRPCFENTLFLEPFSLARNWLLDLKWNDAQKGPIRFSQLGIDLQCIVDLLCQNPRIDTIIVQYSCPCTFVLWEDDYVLDETSISRSYYKYSRRGKATLQTLKLLDSLKKLRVAKAARFDPIVSQMKPFPFFVDAPCEEIMCQLTEEIKVIMEGVDTSSALTQEHPEF
ncbi:MAG: hypothetical protein Q9201_001387 [Fulgogasparrea decipioides]